MTRRDQADPMPAILKFQEGLRSAREQVATLVRDKARLVDQRETLSGRHADEPERLQRRWNATERALSAAQAHLAELEAQRPTFCKMLVQEQQRLEVMGIDPAILSLMPTESPS